MNGKQARRADLFQINVRFQSSPMTAVPAVPPSPMPVTPAAMPAPAPIVVAAPVPMAVHHDRAGAHHGALARLRVMLDCSEAYSACLNQNTSLARSRLRAVAADASEKGYLFQACDALLCLSACSLAAGEWQDARRTLLRALDLTVAAENLRSRVFITHYLSVCAHMLGAELECRDWCWQAVLTLSDGAFDGTELHRCLHYNESVAAGRAPQDGVGAAEDGWRPTRRAGMLRWYLFERA